MPQTTDRKPTPLKQYIEEHGFTVGWLGKQCEVGRPFMSEIVNGTATEPTIRRWAPRIAEVLNAPIAVLFPDLSESEEKGGN